MIHKGEDTSGKINAQDTKVFLDSVELNVPQHLFIDDMLDCYSTVHSLCFKHLMLTLLTYSTITMNSEE